MRQFGKHVLCAALICLAAGSANAQFGGFKVKIPPIKVNPPRIRVPSLTELDKRRVEASNRVFRGAKDLTRSTQNYVTDPGKFLDPRRALLPNYKFHLRNGSPVLLRVVVKYKTLDNNWKSSTWNIPPGKTYYLFPTYNRYVYVEANSLDVGDKRVYRRKEWNMGDLFNNYTLTLN